MCTDPTIHIRNHKSVQQSDFGIHVYFKKRGQDKWKHVLSKKQRKKTTTALKKYGNPFRTSQKIQFFITNFLIRYYRINLWWRIGWNCYNIFCYSLLQIKFITTFSQCFEICDNELVLTDYIRDIEFVQILITGFFVICEFRLFIFTDCSSHRV